MNTQIEILHLTDIHWRSENANDIARRLKALLEFTSKKQIKPHYVAITGDLTFSGKKHEFDGFEKEFLQPLCRHFDTKAGNILVVPGNHDVDRDLVSVTMLDKRSRRQNSRDPDILKMPSSRLSAYNEHVKPSHFQTDKFNNIRPIVGGNAQTRISHIAGAKIGFACLNSAFECANDEDKELLILTENQISEALSHIEHCDLRIALIHHPLDWFHPAERDLACNDLTRSFDLILSGHLHSPSTYLTTEPNDSHLWLQSRAFFDGKVSADVQDGFHLYAIDLPNKKIECSFFKYARKRDTYAADTEHAENGAHSFMIPLKKSVMSSQIILSQRVANFGNALQLEIHNSLSMLQDTQDPVIVSPRLAKVKFGKAGKQRQKSLQVPAELISNNAVIFGPRDSGKSILLKQLAAEYPNQNVSEDTANQSMIARNTVYVKPQSFGNDASMDSVLEYLSRELDIRDSLEYHQVKIHLLIDEPRGDLPDLINNLLEYSQNYGWSFTIATNSSFAFEAIGQQFSEFGIEFFELLAWGPSKIRELARRLLPDKCNDMEPIMRSIKSSFLEHDLPPNPTTVSLLLGVIAKNGSNIGSVSFLRLLEKIEEMRLGANERPPVLTKYYRTRALVLLAKEIFETNSDVISHDKVKNILCDYLAKPLYGEHASDLIDDLLTSGFLKRDEEWISFVHYAFYDYYLAKAIETSQLSEDVATSSLETCIELAQALSLFAGMRRENNKLSTKLLELIFPRFPIEEKRTLKALDEYIQSLVSPEYGIHEVDDIVDHDRSQKTDSEQDDERFDEGRNSRVEVRKSQFRRTQPLSFDELSMHTMTLDVLYGILKNLEGIDGKDKLEFLDKVLQLHIKTNFYLIEYSRSIVKGDDFRSFVAYVLTWSGYKFMTHSLGTQGICSTLMAALEKGVDNDFKELLILLLLSDLREKESLQKIEDYLKNVNSVSAIEILFMHLRHRIIEQESDSIPGELINAFKLTFMKRTTLYKSNNRRTKQNDAFSKLLRETKLQHKLTRQLGLRY